MEEIFIVSRNKSLKEKTCYDKENSCGIRGNAILTNDPTAIGQQKTLAETAQSLAALVEKGYKLLITHGNGPQVGNLLLQREL